MNISPTSPETERLQIALAGLATALTKTISEKIDQALVEKLPVKLPANPNDKFAEDRILNKKQLAEFFHVSLRTIDNWMGRGIIPYWKIGRHISFRLSYVLDQLDQCCSHGRM